jgi:ribosomal protein S18 acetylase RimI-like enzyme
MSRLPDDPKAEKIVIRGLWFRTEYRRQAWASGLLSALQARFANRPLTIPALVSENTPSGLFQNAGWKQ